MNTEKKYANHYTDDDDEFNCFYQNDGDASQTATTATQTRNKKKIKKWNKK